VRILVTGASGYIGGLIAPLLAEDGHDVVVGGRDPRVLGERFDLDVRAVELDVARPDTLERALDGVDVAYYLVHAMGSGEAGFASRDARAARSFGTAAAAAGVGRVIYLGGLGTDEPGLSAHLRSRHEVGRLLAESGVDVLEFRAAVVIGAGSASFRMIRQLADRLPVMITPRWVRVRCQPIAVRDVVAYLLLALQRPDVRGIVEIGGADVLSYGEMMRRYAALRGMRRAMIPVPVLSPRLSSYWVGLVTDVPWSIARPLIEGLRNEVVVRDPDPARAFPIEPLGYDEAVRRALAVAR
jgi:uncharacterized protein YbjT (DUF2867 family)